jgi:hypothetical protein
MKQKKQTPNNSQCTFPIEHSSASVEIKVSGSQLYTSQVGRVQYRKLELNLEYKEIFSGRIIIIIIIIS